MENIIEEHLIQKSQNLSLKINFDSNNIGNIINNNFYSIINKLDEEIEKINLIYKGNCIINVINYESNNNIIEYKKNINKK